jgi:vacuolar-type H+-ATPase subunit I/STV1
MQKVMIAAHRSQAGQIVSVLQDAGIIEILNAERAMVSKEWPELEMETKRPKDIEDLVARLDKAIAFLKPFATQKDGRSALRPLIEIDKKTYTEIVLGSSALILLDKAERTQNAIDKFQSQLDSLHSEIQKLSPWKELQTLSNSSAPWKPRPASSGYCPDSILLERSQNLKNSRRLFRPSAAALPRNPAWSSV